MHYGFTEKPGRHPRRGDPRRHRQAGLLRASNQRRAIFVGSGGRHRRHHAPSSKPSATNAAETGCASARKGTCRAKEIDHEKSLRKRSRSNRSGRGDDRRRNGRARLFRPEPFGHGGHLRGADRLRPACDDVRRRRRDHSARHRPRHVRQQVQDISRHHFDPHLLLPRGNRATDARRHRRRAQKREAHDQARSVQAGGA